MVGSMLTSSCEVTESDMVDDQMTAPSRDPVRSGSI